MPQITTVFYYFLVLFYFFDEPNNITLLQLLKCVYAKFTFVWIFLGCQEALGMENGVILDAQINASSEFNVRHAANLGRLHVLVGEGKTGAWSAATLDVNQWLQIDLVNQHVTVTRVATQGRNGYNQWVTSYKLQYRGNGENFKYYREQGQTEDKVI